MSHPLALPKWEVVAEVLSEVGIDGRNWPDGFKHILRVPQNLKIFVEHLASTNEHRVFGSYLAMLEELWAQKITCSSDAAARSALLAAVSKKMSDREVLWLPLAEFDEAKLKALSDWAIALEEAGLCQLSTVHGVNDRWILLPRLKSDKVSLVSIWNDGKGYLQFWKSVFERRAPKALERISALIAPVEVRQGNSLRDFDEELLNELTSAYEEATEIQAI